MAIEQLTRHTVSGAASWGKPSGWRTSVEGRRGQRTPWRSSHDAIENWKSGRARA